MQENLYKISFLFYPVCKSDFSAMTSKILNNTCQYICFKMRLFLRDIVKVYLGILQTIIDLSFEDVANKVP